MTSIMPDRDEITGAGPRAPQTRASTGYASDVSPTVPCSAGSRDVMLELRAEALRFRATMTPHQRVMCARSAIGVVLNDFARYVLRRRSAMPGCSDAEFRRAVNAVLVELEATLRGTDWSEFEHEAMHRSLDRSYIEESVTRVSQQPRL